MSLADHVCYLKKDFSNCQSAPFILRILFSSNVKREKGLDSYLFITPVTTTNTKDSVSTAFHYYLYPIVKNSGNSLQIKKTRCRCFRTKNVGCLNYSDDCLNYYTFPITLCKGNLDLWEILVNVQEENILPKLCMEDLSFLRPATQR